MKIARISTKFVGALRSFLFFFLSTSFIVTCTTMLFARALAESAGFALNGDTLNIAAKITFVNVIFLSIIFSLIDALRRRFTIVRATRHIEDAARRMSEGDFSVRVQPLNRMYSDDNLNNIIDCFNKMAEELSSLELLRSDFIANVSHEIKTPIAVINNYATLLSKGGIGDEERAEYAAAISTAAKRLSDMITNVLKLSRLENGEIFPQNEEYDLGEQLTECLLSYESVWEKKGIDIEADIAEGVTVRRDRELLTLVWNNLLSNAFKFTGEGGKVSLTLTADEKSARVRVGDTGCGMTREVGEHIFDKFYQADASRSTAGNGLGLALVKRVVDIIGAEISVESTLGVGSAFTVTFRRMG